MDSAIYGAMKASGCMFGLAYGDALGKPTEFLNYDQIIRQYGPTGPLRLNGNPALVTDDTQMTLAVADALLDALADDAPASHTPATLTALTAETLAPHLRQRYQAWAISPENNRAPGMTCLRSIGRMSEGLPWTQATEQNSKGCGANMRVAPVGLVPGLSDPVRAAAAQFQSALTHGHPTALAASDLTAFSVHWLADGMSSADLLPALQERCLEQSKVYHEDWLGLLWQRPGIDSPEDFIARGWKECFDALGRVAAALRTPNHNVDPCLATGAGWIAEEALATALHCFLLYPDPEQVVAMLGRGAATGGDSDSIASIAGAFAGAAHGFAAWPTSWADQIEYHIDLRRIGSAWD
jgi:ADP-ribosylglycohydrolase